MVVNIAIGVGSFVAGILLVLFLRRPKKVNYTKQNLNRFNFDKSKKYEKDGRKYPFSY